MLYRKIINVASNDAWEKLVFEDTYKEFLMQAQTFDPERKYPTFAHLLHSVPGADRLHFLVGPSVVGYLKQLNGKMPDIINVVDKHFMPFKNYRFEIINSDRRDKAVHRVAINFISEPFVWHSTINDRLLVSAIGGKADENDGDLTEMFVMQPFLSIFSIKQSTDDHAI